eukprot:3281318-Pyramimonas_sp.AAC.1
MKDPVRVVHTATALLNNLDVKNELLLVAITLHIDVCIDISRYIEVDIISALAQPIFCLIKKRAIRLTVVSDSDT